jgi:hypothetical protein
LSQAKQEVKQEEKLPIFRRYDLTGCEEIYRKEAEEASRLYHTLRFARKERYQMREILLELSAAEPYYEDSMKKEVKCYSKVLPYQGESTKVSLALAEHIRRYCERSVEWRRA